MNSAVIKPWTVEQFLAWEEKQELRYEFDGARPVAMTAGTAAHDVIQIDLVTALNNHLCGQPCRVRGNSLKIRVMGSIRYPDAFVTCSPIERDATVHTEPVVVFEVISKSTAHTDRMVKNQEYAGTKSIVRYVMQEQRAPWGTMFTRVGADDDWVGHILGADAVIHMPEIGIDLPLAEIYANLDFSEPADDEADD